MSINQENNNELEPIFQDSLYDNIPKHSKPQSKGAWKIIKRLLIILPILVIGLFYIYSIIDTSFNDTIKKLYVQQKYKQCIEIEEKVIKFFPFDSDLIVYKALSHSALLEHDEAIKAYKEATKTVGTEIYFLYLGWEYYNVQDYDNAQNCVDRLMKIYPQNNNVLELKKYVELEKKPEGERIGDFIRDNYLYLSKVKDYSYKSAVLSDKTKVTYNDIYSFLESIRYKDDKYSYLDYYDDEDYFDEDDEEYDEEYWDEEDEEQYIEKEDVVKKDDEKKTNNKTYTPKINQSVEYKDLGNNLQYIKIKEFTPKTALEFRSSLDMIKKTTESNLVIDLRNNLGGVDVCIDMLELLLPKCTAYYFTTRDGKKELKNTDSEYKKFKNIFIFINENTASCSEILTLSLKSNLNNVTLIGKKTYGKGVVQSIYDNKEKMYKLAIVSRYWYVKDINVQGKGINPDIVVDGKNDSIFFDEVKKTLDK